ncbi:MAG: Hint domain-containing protein [Silicimonas sp.]|nr:Hint domain-containing protein [Silicimonas sp.]
MPTVKNITKGNVAIAGATGLCTGANLRTPIGARRVEFFRPGDLVVTRDNGLQPVRMIWSKTVTAAEMAADPSLAPITLAPRAIGPMMPQHKVSIGGAHRLLVPGWRLDDVEDTENCLVPARDLEGLGEKTEIGDQDVTYYNIVFETPQVFCANGLPIESFSPRSEILKIVPKKVCEDLRQTFPDLSPKLDDYPAPEYKMRERVSYTPSYA